MSETLWQLHWRFEMAPTPPLMSVDASPSALHPAVRCAVQQASMPVKMTPCGYHVCHAVLPESAPAGSRIGLRAATKSAVLEHWTPPTATSGEQLSYLQVCLQ